MQVQDRVIAQYDIFTLNKQWDPLSYSAQRLLVLLPVSLIYSDGRYV